MTEEFEEPAQSDDLDQNKKPATSRLAFLSLIAGVITLIVLLYFAY